MPLLTSANRPIIMGILNITPDSFSGDGLLMADDYVAAALDLAKKMIEDGASILDVGGESSRPGAVPVDEDEEMRRVIPVIKALKEKLGAVHIAIDTVKVSVAEAALKAGATILNDISALASDPKMAALVAKHQAYVVLMHNMSNQAAVSFDKKLGSQYHAPRYGSITEDVKHDLALRAQMAEKAGIDRHKIILDPGIGFGKTIEQNLALINHIDQLKLLQYPVLIGVSRKSFIGRALNLPVEERLEGTAACMAAAVLRGGDIFRVHDVKFMARVAQMAALILKS